jgi:betaine-aldehyde dehydrogenase
MLSMATAAELVDGRRGAPEVVIGVAEDPNTGTPIGDLRATDPAVVEQALAAAQRAWARGDGEWSRRSVADRALLLRRLAAELDARAEAFATVHAQEVGVPIALTKLFAGGVAGVVEEIAATAERVLEPQRLDAGSRRVEILRLPWGPAALLASWNAPAFVAATKLANALAAGCPAILKPSEYTPATTGLLVDALLAADLGPGAVQVVCGSAQVGRQLVSDGRVKLVSYTGGTAGGRAVAEAAVGRMAALQLELSASNPALVVQGADLDSAARELAQGALVLNGQWCEAPRRVFVHRSEHDRLAALIVERMAERAVGSSLDPATDVGPLAYRAHLERVQAQLHGLQAHGDAVASHPTLPQQGFFLSPTVVGGLPFDAVREEIFGPVLALHPYDALEDALEAANSLDDGLAGYVFAGDRTAAFGLGARLHAGEIRIGGTRVLDLAPGSAQSFWGTSGFGGHGREMALEAHVGVRVVGEEDPGLPL